MEGRIPDTKRANDVTDTTASSALFSDPAWHTHPHPEDESRNVFDDLANASLGVAKLKVRAPEISADEKKEQFEQWIHDRAMVAETAQSHLRALDSLMRTGRRKDEEPKDFVLKVSRIGNSIMQAINPLLDDADAISISQEYDAVFLPVIKALNGYAEAQEKENMTIAVQSEVALQDHLLLVHGFLREAVSWALTENIMAIGRKRLELFMDTGLPA